MSKNILVISASPRRGGNSEMLADGLCQHGKGNGRSDGGRA